MITTWFCGFSYNFLLNFKSHRNIPAKDEKPDPYVKLYLLPGRSKETKRKTVIAKESCDPVYEATFEYIISSAELNNTELEVTVATTKGIFSGGSPIIGMVIYGFLSQLSLTLLSLNPLSISFAG